MVSSGSLEEMGFGDSWESHPEAHPDSPEIPLPLSNCPVYSPGLRTFRAIGPSVASSSKVYWIPAEKLTPVSCIV